VKFILKKKKRFIKKEMFDIKLNVRKKRRKVYLIRINPLGIDE
jgi:hypothetical protein